MDAIERIRVWHDQVAVAAAVLAEQARERGAHDLAEQYASEVLRHRAAAERSRLVWSGMA